jgi:hypothetical protein
MVPRVCNEIRFYVVYVIDVVYVRRTLFLLGIEATGMQIFRTKDCQDGVYSWERTQSKEDPFKQRIVDLFAESPCILRLDRRLSTAMLNVPKDEWARAMAVGVCWISRWVAPSSQDHAAAREDDTFVNPY